MRLLVTGAAGMLGHRVVADARARGLDPVGVDIDEVDITDRRATLVELLPHAVLPELPELTEYHQELHRAAGGLTIVEQSGVAAFLQRLEQGADTATAAMRGRRDGPSQG